MTKEHTLVPKLGQDSTVEVNILFFLHTIGYNVKNALYEMTKFSKPVVLVCNDNHQPVGLLSAGAILSKMKHVVEKRSRDDFYKLAASTKLKDLPMDEMIAAKSTMTVEQAANLM